VLDASGRYASQFLWGNSYWLGSYTLCQQLHFNAEQEGSAPPFPAAYSVVSLSINVTWFLRPQVRTNISAYIYIYIYIYTYLNTKKSPEKNVSYL
jgi:hypothetical protein